MESVRPFYLGSAFTLKLMSIFWFDSRLLYFSPNSVFLCVLFVFQFYIDSIFICLSNIYFHLTLSMDYADPFSFSRVLFSYNFKLIFFCLIRNQFYPLSRNESSFLLRFFLYIWHFDFPYIKILHFTLIWDPFFFIRSRFFCFLFGWGNLLFSCHLQFLFLFYLAFFFPIVRSFFFPI